MPLIEKFKINNLYNYYDVELDFKNDKTIYIGEMVLVRLLFLRCFTIY